MKKYILSLIIISSLFVPFVSFAATETLLDPPKFAVSFLFQGLFAGTLAGMFFGIMTRPFKGFFNKKI